MIQTQTLQFNIFTVLFRSFLVIFIAGILMYVFFVYTATMNIVHRKSLEKQIITTTVNVSNLEHAYIKLRTAITPLFAESLDFTEPQNIIFAQYDTRQDLAKITN